MLDTEILVEEIADFEVPRAQPFRGGEQFRLLRVRLFFLLAAVGVKPVEQEFEFQVLDAVVIEDLFHFLETPALHHVIEIRVPDAHAFESDFRNRLDPVAEIEWAVLLTGTCRIDIAGYRPV